MNIETVFGLRRPEIMGTPVDADHVNEARLRFPKEVSDAAVFTIWSEVPITGVAFYIDEDDDPTGMGVELRWMSIAEAEDEALNAFPGRAFAPLGFLPVGICLLGSGDPYFLDLRSESDDPPLVRIPHETLNLSEIEIVVGKLSEFIAAADIENPANLRGPA